jgi:hypothetical protein
LKSDALVAPYAKEFPSLKSDRVLAFPASLQEAKTSKDAEVQLDAGQTLIPLSALMEYSVIMPLRAQMKLVNSALLNYVLLDAHLLQHLRAIRM